MEFVTIDDAVQHIRIDTNADDVWLQIWIPAVSDSVATWLKDPWRPYVLAVDEFGALVLDADGNPTPALDTEGNPIVRPIVKAAVLVELAQQHQFRAGEEAPAVPTHWGHGYTLGAGATSLLAGLRKTTVA